MSESSPLAVLTSGGDAPGMKAAIRAIAKVAASHGVPVVGVENGNTGLLEGRLRPLTVADEHGEGLGVDPEMDFLGSLGGTVLGSARELRFLSASGRAPALRTLATADASVTRFGLTRVLEESRALVDGTSPITQRRVKMMETIEGVLGL